MANIINGTQTGNGGLVTSGDDSGILQLQTNETTAVTIDASQDVTVANDLFVTGNVGIGTAPSAWATDRKALQVNLTSLSGGNNNNFSVLSNNNYFDGSNQKYIISAAASMYVQNTSGEHLWYTAGSGTAGDAISFTERMRIDSSGNLLVGTTSGLGGDGQRVAIKSTDTTGLRVYRATATTSNAIQIWQSDVGGTAAEKYFVLANGTATSSDQRLKENIEDVNGCLDKLLQVRVRNFTWKEQDGNEKDIGVIAQEIEQVLPEMVWENPNVAEGSVAYKAVRYDKLTPMLVKAIQEQQAQISSQAAVITTLTERITALEGATQ